MWTPDGVPVCGDSCVVSTAKAIADGTGGAFIVWREGRNYSQRGDDVYAQRITSSGTIAPGWPSSGLPICAAIGDQTPESIAPDGEGGFLVSWHDSRANPSGGSIDVYAQRVRSDGTLAPSWPLNGTPATTAPSTQDISVIGSDGSGGAYVAWWDWTNYATHGIDVYLQHLSSTGAVWSGWPPDGLPVSAFPNNQALPTLLPDGTGGVAIAWTDVRRGIGDIYANRILPDGSTAPGWVEHGIPVLLDRQRSQVVPDHAGGFFVASGRLNCGCIATQANGWSGSARHEGVDNVSLGFDDGFYAQRVMFDGQIAPGWPVEGLTVCQLPGDRGGIKAVEDGQGGMLMTWYDYRVAGGDIFAARVRPDATLAPGWPFQGLQVSDPFGPGLHYDPVIAPDGAGGAYVAWEITRTVNDVSEVVIYVQHLAADGGVAPGWPMGGLRATPRQYSRHPVIVSDGSGGAIVIWDELGLYAQRYVADGPVAVQLALASAEATFERVVLRWHGVGAAALTATVERRTERSGWETRGAAVPDGADALGYEDHTVETGTRYAYRLAYEEQGTRRHTTESWVEVPRELRLALEGFTPNPGPRRVAVTFTLPDDSPAVLELFDLAGRRVRARDVGSLGPGRHQIALEGERDLDPGVFILRLRRGDESRIARGVIAR